MNKILKILTSRIFLWVVLMLIQILWFIVIFYAFSYNIRWAGIFMQIMTYIVVLTIVNKQDNPSYKLAWSITILALPIPGLALYALIGRTNITVKNRKRLSVMHAHSIAGLKAKEEVIKSIENRSRGAAKQSEYLSKWSGYQVHKNQGLRYFSSGEDVMEPILLLHHPDRCRPGMGVWHG